MKPSQLGLTSRLALVGVASATVPFVAALALLLLVPDRAVDRVAARDLDRLLAVGVERIRADRAELQAAVDGVSPAVLGDAVRRNRTTSLQRVVADRLGSAARDRAGNLRIAVRAGDDQRASDGPVVAYLRVEGVNGADGSTIAIRHPVEDRLDELVGGTGAALRVAGPRGLLGDQGTGQDISVAGVRDDGRPRLEFEGEPATWRASVLDADRRLVLVAERRGGRLELLAGGRAAELGVAFVLLLAAALFGGVAVALVMNRVLGGVASRSERLASGDLASRMPVVGHDAGARVARSLNDLASELQARISSLEQTVDRLDRTLEAIGDGVCAWSPRATIETWNAGAESLSGVTGEQIRMSSRTASMLAGELAPGRRRVMLPVDGGDRRLAVDLVVGPTRDGGTLQVFRDAAPTLAIEQARQNFLVTAAHELRTPLASILGFAATLADDQVAVTPEVRAQMLAEVRSQAERLDHVVSGFFAAGMLGRDRVDVHIERVEVQPLVVRVAAALDRDDFDTSGVGGGAAVAADRDALERVLHELLDNACKYGRGPIEVLARPLDGDVHIVVRDHGEEVPAEHVESVFEPFFRLDPDMRAAVGGTGMGLYTARRLVEAMGGSIAYVRRAGAVPASELQVTLPAAAPLRPAQEG